MQPNTPKIRTEKNVFKDNFQARERKFYSPLIIGRQLKDNAKKAKKITKAQHAPDYFNSFDAKAFFGEESSKAQKDCSRL